MSEEINVTAQNAEEETAQETENKVAQIKLTRSEQREQAFMLLF